MLINVKFKQQQKTNITVVIGISTLNIYATSNLTLIISRAVHFWHYANHSKLYPFSILYH